MCMHLVAKRIVILCAEFYCSRSIEDIKDCKVGHFVMVYVDIKCL